MPIVFIPAELRPAVGGAAQMNLPGATVGQLVEALEAACPGVAARLVRDGRLAPGWAVSIDGRFSARGLRAPIKPESEVHFLPAIGGG
jgi:sulfur-carrier protein